MQSLDDMAIFAAVVDAGGFSAASKSVGVSTPVISKRISALEAELGARLLNRTTRRLSLTEVGSVFYQHCIRVVAEARDAEAAVTFLHEVPRGLLRITAPIAFGSEQIARVLPGFMERYPEVQVEMDVSDRPVELAAEGYDVAIRLTSQPPPLLAARRLKGTRRVVCAAPGYWERYGRPQRPADLVSHNCIVYYPNPTFNEWHFESAGGAETISVNGRYRVNNTVAILEAAVSGLGVARLSSFTVERYIESGELEPVLLDYTAPGADIYALYLPNRYLSTKARAFIDYMVAWYQNPEHTSTRAP